MREVLRLEREAWCLHEHDRHAAAAHYELACTLARELIMTAPQHSDNWYQLGSMLYTLGEWYLEMGDYEAATAALDGAEATYTRQGEEETGELIADVVLRRARVHAAARRPLSAIVDAQHAALSALDPGRPLESTARVLAHVGRVQLMIGGDPDLAAAAADWSVRAYLSMFRTIDPAALESAHAIALRVAANVSQAVHTAAGRHDLARAAHKLVMATGGSIECPGSEYIRCHQPTLARVLGAAECDGLPPSFTASTPEDRILVPAMRCHTRPCPGLAKTLARLQFGVPDRDQLLLGLEAHAIFAAAAQQPATGTPVQAGDFVPSWAAVTVNFGQRMFEQDELSAAADAVGWLNGIIGQLVPRALIDSDTRSVVLDCLHWQHRIHAATGDSKAADRISRTITTLADPVF
ncbi:hypothetical protein [Nocardia sp. alder85J]|uniref:hypothetical protein n=1 Tax=Nocardia sp. alder85J TaxID=2862949 RepID=UPI001CD5BF2D|nr:hypothetical protein [Nocardia sp. alder85J]MCX4091700.1 hypothetical protein [Nocardia sp. alder85J]